MEMETVIMKSLDDSRRQEKRSASKIQQLESSMQSQKTKAQSTDTEKCQKIKELENEIRRLKSKERRQEKRNRNNEWPESRPDNRWPGPQKSGWL